MNFNIDTIIDTSFVIYRKYKRVFSFVGLVLAMALGLTVYWLYSSKLYEQRSQQALSDLLVDFNKAYASPELWNDVEVGSRTAAKQFSQSKLLPYFLVLQSEALLQQEKTEQALEFFEQALRAISSKMPYYFLYKIKYARIKLNQGSEVLRKQGLQELQALASDAKNIFQDQALYYLAHYYQSENDTQKAQETYETLQKLYKESDRMASPWALLAQQEN